MELLLTPTDFVIKQRDFSLWCDRNSGSGNIIPKENAFSLSPDPIVCIGYIYGFVGRIRFFHDGDWYMVVITKHSQMSNFSDSSIYRIDKVALIPLIQNVHVESFDFDLPSTIRRSDFQNVLKEFMHSKTSPLSSDTPSTLPSCSDSDQDKTRHKENTRREKLEGKFCETFVRMFNDSNFYYSLDCDLTNSLQRQFFHGPFSWKNLDDRFFWNKSMLDELFQYDENLSNPWILPVIQGFYDTTSCSLNFHSIPSLLTKQLHSTPKANLSIHPFGVDNLFSGTYFSVLCLVYV
ncbi:hypothetical protein LOD99_4804 [Oopsacas minuta]|uniref:SAC domain-containing protein n=1 Tax=Oopsacas minuta TaxID=111878 RepID=A0AAV7JU08_9METZ|nr:hypothetical protein LOD99_4804 [Oopsacas minuta]